MSNCDLAQRFIRMVADAGLPTPDESWREAGAIALRWSDTGFVVPLDPDREDLAPLDELEAAMIKGLPPDGSPWPTAEGYADYKPWRASTSSPGSASSTES